MSIRHLPKNRNHRVSLDAMQLMLERLGYNVKVRMSGIEALETFRNRPDGCDLVITDMTMPKMTGEMGIRAFVMKPIVMHDLAGIIREVLDNK